MLLLVACAHAPTPDETREPDPNAPPAGVSAAPGPAVLTIVWANPSPRFAVACGGDLFDGHQHWLRGAAAQGALTERFMIRAGTGKIQCFVADAAEFRTRWAIFEDDYACNARANLRLDLDVQKLPDGGLAFDGAYSAEGCRVHAAEVGRRVVSRRSDLPPRICCGEHRGDFRED
jgi:hypothetical protein